MDALAFLDKGFNAINIGLIINIIFWFLTVLFIVLSIILVYHWKRYSASKLFAFKATAIYLLGSAIFFGTMVITYIIIQI